MGWGGGWGNHVPQTAKDVAAAFYAGRECRRSGCETDGETYYLCGHAIARRTDIPKRVAMTLINQRLPAAYPLQFSFAGWSTSTTVRHLLALGVPASISRGQALIHGVAVDSHCWYLKLEIDQLADQPKYDPRPKREPRFVNLTLPLFT